MKPIFSKKRFQDPELMILRSELLEAQSELAQAYRQFNQAVDPELVESCIYQISAVKARCNYLMGAIATLNDSRCRPGGRRRHMDLNQKILAAILAAFFLIALIRVFQTPLRLALKLLANTLLGFLALWVVNLTAGVTGITLGLNLLNALVIGILGLPGFVLLLLTQWVL